MATCKIKHKTLEKTFFPDVFVVHVIMPWTWLNKSQLLVNLVLYKFI